jgi:hypothetical protein
MKLSERSYPHPVLGNADDVPDVAFQATCEVNSDKQFFFITVTVNCSSTTLMKMVKKDEAAYVLHVECSNTMYREAFDFTEPQRRFNIRADRLNGQVVLNCFIRAKKGVSKYKIDGAHEDYGDATFDLRKGDILAVGDPAAFEAESQDTLRKIGSIMVIEQSDKDGDHPMEADFNGDKIHIRLCKEDFEQYKKLKVHASLSSHLTTTIVLPVLAEAIHEMKESPDTYQDLKWCRNLQTRLGESGLENDDVLHVAQVLLDMPLRRALTSANEYVDGN